MAGRGVICAVYGCFNYKIQSDRKSFYRFPKNKVLCTQWVVKSRRADLDEILRTKGPEYLNKGYVVCSDHFTEKDFRNKNLLSQGIWPGAVPSLKCHNVQQVNLRCSVKKREREHESTPEISNELPTGSAVQEDNKMPAEEKLNKCCSDLMLKYRTSQKLLSKYKSLYKSLRRQLCVVQKKQSKHNCEKTVVDKSVAQNFIHFQLNQGNCKAQGRRYSSTDKSFALALHYISPESYKFLQKHFSLPSTRSLKSWFQNAQVEPGVNKMVLSLLETKDKKMKREGTVISMERWEGYEDFGVDTPVQPITAPICQQRNQPVIFMQGLECSTAGEKVADIQPKPHLPEEETSSLMLDEPSFAIQQVKSEFKTEETSIDEAAPTATDEAAPTDEAFSEILNEPSFDIQLVKSEIKSEFISSDEAESADETSSQVEDMPLFTTPLENSEVKIEYTSLDETGFPD
ncbi:DNA transposase THAP9 [Anabrus simplex]|uniref:DNA transposase THAP9 n=1 Tax=Anabrus simplex TaxID=316456 RepID=UPI0035A2E9EC